MQNQRLETWLKSTVAAVALMGAAATPVLIDGRSGSGKSTLAVDLHDEWTGSAVVRLDDALGLDHDGRWPLMQGALQARRHL